MKRYPNLSGRLVLSLSTAALLALCLCLFSFNTQVISAHFLQQLGISQADADEKIANSILGGYLDQQGVQQAKNIAAGNRKAVIEDLFQYSKSYLSSPSFIQAYADLREQYRPQEQEAQSPEAMREEMIRQLEASVAANEAAWKNADAGLKPIFAEVLATSRKMLEEARSPDNAQIAAYTQNYPQMQEIFRQTYLQQFAQWEAEYPADHLLFIRGRLQQFLDETANIDFSAELTVKNGKKVFLNPDYEKKGLRWKMAYRAGREAVETARALVSAWMREME